MKRRHPCGKDFEPSRFKSALRRMDAQGARLLTHAEAGGTEESRRRRFDTKGQRWL